MVEAKNKLGLLATSKKAKSLFYISRADYADWLASAPPHWQNWLTANGFDVNQPTALVLPDRDGNIAAAIVNNSGDAVADGGQASRLPTGSGDFGLDAHYIKDFAGDITKSPQFLFALGWALENYRFAPYKKPKPAAKPNLVTGNRLFHRVSIIAESICLVRDLINTPANVMTPAGLEAAASAIAQANGAKIKVVAGAELVKNFPAIHSVGRSAETPPRLIEINWQSKSGKTKPPITLIGKGVSFDSGGLNIKPASAMLLMKKDMGGAAHVLGLAQAIMQLDLGVSLRVLVAAAENAVSHRAMRPLDVIDTAAGIPVEIGHTDAEGRLLLADMLHYASQTDNALLLDFATLTGAARIALGTDLPAMFANDDGLAEALLRHAKATHDPLWRLPLYAPYAKQLELPSHALSSTGKSRYGGAITAALFLQKFLASPQKWVHLDMMAWNLSPRPAHPVGGEAMAFRAVLALVQEIAAQ